MVYAGWINEKTVYMWFRWENKRKTCIFTFAGQAKNNYMCTLAENTNGLLPTLHICAGSFAENPRGGGNGGTHVLICAGILVPIQALCKFLPTATKRDSFTHIVSLPEWLRGCT